MTTNENKLRPVRWDWDNGPGRYVGVTDGTTWNGFLNVWVSPETARKVADDLCYAGDKTTAGEILAIQPDESGLIDLRNGWCIVEVPAETVT